MLLGSEENVWKHKDAHAHRQLSVYGSCSTCFNCMSASVGSGVPSHGGGVAMVTESATLKSEGQES